jgi:hypothetical protein
MLAVVIAGVQMIISGLKSKYYLFETICREYFLIRAERSLSTSHNNRIDLGEIWQGRDTANAKKAALLRM